jgi:PAS domain S-box-containing protein
MGQFTANNSNPVFRVEKDGTVLYSNVAEESLLNDWGLKAGAKLPSYIRDIVQRTLAQNIPEEIKVPVNKRTYLIAFHPLPEEECVNVYGFDISEQIETEATLHEAYEQIQVQSEELQISNEESLAQSSKLHESNRLLHDNETGFRTLAENSPDLIARFDRQNYCLYANPAAMKFYDLSAIAEFYGPSVDEFISKTNFKAQIDHEMVILSEKQRANIFATGKPEAMEFHYVSPHGKEYYFDTKIVPEFISGEITSVLVISRDITALNESEAKLNETLENLEKLVKKRTDELEEAYNLLKESEKGLAEAQKMAHMGNWDWNLVTNEFCYSDELYRIFGLTPQEFDVPFDEVLTYIHPEDRDYVTNSIIEALNGKIYDDIDFRIILADGTERTIHTQGEVIFDEKNIPIRMRGTVQDITEHKQMDEALRESEQKYRNIIETTNEGIVVIDAELRITYVNNRLMEKGGYSQEEVIGRLWWDFTDEEGKAISRLHMDKRRQGIDEVYELRLIRKDGSSFWVLVSSKSLFDKYGKFAGSLSMLTDVTERKEAEEKIKSLANIVESSNDAIITKSLDGTITSWNKGAEQVYGYSAEEVLGRPISIIEPDNLKGEIKQLADEVKQGKNVKHYETSRLKKDGTIINVSVTLSPVFDQYGKLVAISCIGGDIIEKKIAEKLIEEKKMAEVANRTKNDFLAKISHELRTPLNSIIGFSDMLHEQAYGEMNEKQLRVTGYISKSGKHLLKLINNILDISKVEAGKMELNYKNFELAAKLNLIRNLLSPIADRKSIKIEIYMDSKLTSICADEDKFAQIMYNLVDNAIKFSYENSLVKIGARKKGDLVEITVEDTGIGIKVENEYKLFKPFSQIDSFSSRKSQGTGLGLSLVKQIVHLHGGYVWFRSNPSKGSTFAFAIPINNTKGNIG